MQVWLAILKVLPVQLLLSQPRLASSKSPNGLLLAVLPLTVLLVAPAASAMPSLVLLLVVLLVIALALPPPSAIEVCLSQSHRSGSELVHIGGAPAIGFGLLESMVCDPRPAGVS